MIYARMGLVKFLWKGKPTDSTSYKDGLGLGRDLKNRFRRRLLVVLGCVCVWFVVVALVSGAVHLI
jgi:hypothetical protein